MSEADRERYRKDVLSLAERLSGAGDENAVWDVYAGTEKLIAVLKFRLDYETPGVFTKLPDASDPPSYWRVPASCFRRPPRRSQGASSSSPSGP